jgi:hypothetical protein
MGLTHRPSVVEAGSQAGRKDPVDKDPAGRLAEAAEDSSRLGRLVDLWLHDDTFVSRRSSKHSACAK